MIKAQCSKDLHIPIRQAEKICHYIFGSDLDFYEEYLIDLPDEEQERFFDDNPDFMSVFLWVMIKCICLRIGCFEGF